MPSFFKAFKSKKSAKDDLKNVSSNQPESQTSKQRQRIAIIGSGVSGLTCAYYLSPDYDVTVFEANDYIGGHVNTIDVNFKKNKRDKSPEKSAIDTGFIVFNERTYPNFFRLIHELNVPFQATDMSFSVKNMARKFEYNGHTINTLLSQRRNALRPKFWRFVQDILRFNKHIKALLAEFNDARASGDNEQQLSQQTLGDYLSEHHYGDLFTNNYLLPMVSAIWSMGLDDAKGFPLVFFAQFFEHHGLLDVVNRPRWFTIKGGSKQYVVPLVKQVKAKGGKFLTQAPVQSVTRLTHASSGNDNNNAKQIEQVSIEYMLGNQPHRDTFDNVIFACHADTALKLLSDATDSEQAVLSQFTFTANEAILHTDTSVLPNKPLAWASWNYLLPKSRAVNGKNETLEKPILTYHMNILQRLNKRHNYLVTLNHEVDKCHVIKRIDYTHPVYSLSMVQAQHRWQDISNQANTEHTTHFCGAYWFNGFHEDGVKSGLRVCQDLGVEIAILDKVNPKHLDGLEEPNKNFSLSKLPVKADINKRKLKKRIVTANTATDTIK